ncbi:MAG: helix-turn-helix domain-containing protein [Chloroflexi bacterium]|nr:helix-turn-helix domain-containing protein [Chloroflexota bacterium]
MLANVWHCEPETGNRNLVANCVRRIRDKIGEKNDQHFDLQALPAIGYRLRVCRVTVSPPHPFLPSRTSPRVCFFPSHLV